MSQHYIHSLAKNNSYVAIFLLKIDFTVLELNVVKNMFRFVINAVCVCIKSTKIFQGNILNGKLSINEG